MQPTLNLFHHLYNTLPPLFPADIKQEMAGALSDLISKGGTASDVEETMIGFGYEVWPWNRAYRDFYNKAEEEVGEHFFMPTLSPWLQEKYDNYKIYGGTLGELRTGNPTEFFNHEERNELKEALVNLDASLEKFVNQQIISLEHKKYLLRVEEAKILLAEMRRLLFHLRHLGDSEQNHPEIVNEIRSKVRGYEQGLCLLGPEPNLHEVKNSVEFFIGRRKDLNRMRGIHSPIQVDFYS
jgi:hypothetical protein